MGNEENRLRSMDRIRDLGFEILGEFKRVGNKTYLKDKENYEYFVCPMTMLAGFMPICIGSNNPYSIKNIKNWIKINNISIDILEEEYKNNYCKMYWKCNICENNFYACWGNISQGKRCPYCGNKKSWERHSLAYDYPNVSKDWNYDKNVGMIPEDVLPHSEKYYWWKCECGHEWYAQVCMRTERGTGCPMCSHHLVSYETSLEFLFPEVANEWNYEKNYPLKPLDILSKSSKKYWWICTQCNHEWNAVVASRTRIKTGCPSCNDSKGEKAIKEYLSKKSIAFIPEYSTNDCRFKYPLEFDFAIFNTIGNICLCEFDGEHHEFPVDFAGRGKEWALMNFNLVQERDEVKNEYCQINNILLIRISFRDFDKIENIMDKKLKKFLRKED